MPLGDPGLAHLCVADDQAGDRAGQVVDGPDAQPGVLHLAVGGQALGILDARLGIDEDQRAHAVWGQQRGAHREKAALRHPAEHGLLDAQVVEQSQAVARRVPVGERPAVELSLSEPALVPGDDAIPRAQYLHLRGEHLAVHEKAVREDDRRTVAAGVLEADPLAVDVGEGHDGHSPGVAVRRDST